jgi:hypothetical protein
LTILAFDINIRSGFDKIFHHGISFAHDTVNEGGSASVICVQVQLGAGLNEKPEDFMVSLSGGNVKQGYPGLVSGIRREARSKKEGNFPETAFTGAGCQ